MSARKALEEYFNGDEDEEESDDADDDGAEMLNLADEEGKRPSDLPMPIVYLGAEDVWDEDSAYMEMLAKEVSLTKSGFTPAVN